MWTLIICNCFSFRFTLWSIHAQCSKNVGFPFSDLAVCNITGMKFITLWTTWRTSLSGGLRRLCSAGFHSRRLTISFFFFFYCQSSATDVFYRLFDRRTNSHGADRRQVPHQQTSFGIFILLLGFDLMICILHPESKYEPGWRSSAWSSRVGTRTCTSVCPRLSPLFSPPAKTILKTTTF